MIGGALLILAGAASLVMMVGGFSSMDAQNGEVEYFEVWLPPWFLLAEIMLFSSMAAVSIVTGATAMGRNVQGASTIGAICSLIGFGFMFGLLSAHVANAERKVQKCLQPLISLGILSLVNRVSCGRNGQASSCDSDPRLAL